MKAGPSLAPRRDSVGPTRGLRITPTAAWPSEGGNEPMVAVVDAGRCAEIVSAGDRG